MYFYMHSNDSINQLGEDDLIVARSPSQPQLDLRYEDLLESTDRSKQAQLTTLN